MFIHILVWLAIVVVGYFAVNKWFPSSDSHLKLIHNIILGLAAIGTLSLIVAGIF